MSTRFYDTDLTDAASAFVAPVLPAARLGGRPRTTNLRAVLNAIFYLLRTGCQWRLLPREFPPFGTVYHYFQAWQNSGVWVYLHRVLYEQARRHAGRAACPSVVIMDGQSVKTTERGGARGFDAHKRVLEFGHFSGRACCNCPRWRGENLGCAQGAVNIAGASRAGFEPLACALLVLHVVKHRTGKRTRRNRG
jgi:transposase